MLRAAVGLLPAVAPLHPKLARGHRGRRSAAGRLAAWASAHRDRARPLLWLHAPSVGEGLQARVVLEVVRARHPEWQVVYTYFSPSAEALAATMPADVAEYIPYDTPRAIGVALDALAPAALVFAKLDLWPELATRAAARGARVGIIAATVSPGSGRSQWPSRDLTRPGYRAVSAAGAIDLPDALRLVVLGVARDRVTTTGDPRFDSALAVVRAVSPDEPLLRWGDGQPTLVAGSTWPADEQVILDAWVAVRRESPDARLILAPHEPTPARLRAVEAAARRRGLPAPVRLSQAAAPDLCLLVDQVGMLARLYGAGRMAYVGGGFGHAGLHSVLEPAAWGVPVVFGPRHENSRDAHLLRDAGAAMALPVQSRGAATRLAAIWQGWLRNETARREAGERGLAVVEAGLGAAERSAALVEGLMMH